MGEYSIKTEVGELACSLAVASEWEKREEYISELEAAIREKDADLITWGRRVGALSAALERAEAQRDELLKASRAAISQYQQPHLWGPAANHWCAILGNAVAAIDAAMKEASHDRPA